MRKILAVSGGIDSVTMLHMFRNDRSAIVAHFNHGIRPNSTEDQMFVQKLAEKYGLEFVTKSARLGQGASEATARQARYEFLFDVCEKYQGKLYTAHHQDDIFETIAINILRGTGWRGLAPLRDKRIERPLLNLKKNDIYIYATKNHLTFRQDQTNTEDDYLRNRVRVALMAATSDQKKELFELYRKQCAIADEIEQIMDNQSFASDVSIRRSIFQETDDNIGQELLREVLKRSDISQTRPQLRRALMAIRDYQPGKRFPLNKNHYLQITKYNFSIKKANG